MDNFVVAIDGPAGSGKSSISKIIAKDLGFTHIDTGAMYRAVTLEALNRGINLENEDEYTFLNDISVIYTNGIIYLNNNDVSKEIRTSVVTNNVSTPAKLKVVRDKMVEFQRESAKLGKVIMDGRDIGSVVLPNANLKVFLTATPECRAERRCKENKIAGLESDYNVILKEIIERDYKDSHRAIAPLTCASDAIMLDTTSLNIEQVCNEIKKMINERMNGKMEKSFEELLNEEANNRLRKGDVVTGKVVLVTDNTVYLAIPGVASEGTIHLDHYTKDKTVTTFKGLVNLDDEITCTVTKVSETREGDMVILLSHLNQVADEAFKEIVKAKEEDKTVTVKLTSDVNGKGFECKLDGYKAFLPKSQAPRDAKIGDVLEVKIIELDEARKNVVVSRRVIETALAQEAKANELEAINVDDVVKATVAKVEKYGAVLKVGALFGLLKVGQYSHVFTADITKELKAGDELEVKVIAKENGKLEFSRKALLETPFNLYVKEHKVSDTVVGKVSAKLPFGLIIEVAKDVKALLHASEYSHNPNDNFNNCVVIGDEVTAAIIKIDEKNEKISLSRKALIENPWKNVTAKQYDVVEIKVTEVKENGLAVEALGVDGFVPANETSGNLNDYAKDDTMKATIIEINPKEWKLKLSIKKYLAAEERKSYEKYLNSEEDATSTIGDIADLK